MKQKIIPFARKVDPRETKTVEVFRRGLLAIRVEMPQATYLEVERAASASHESVELIVYRYVQRLSAEGIEGVRPRRNPCR